MATSKRRIMKSAIVYTVSGFCILYLYCILYHVRWHACAAPRAALCHDRRRVAECAMALQTVLVALSDSHRHLGRALERALREKAAVDAAASVLAQLACGTAAAVDGGASGAGGAGAHALGH